MILLEDTAAVQQAKSALMIIYAEGDRAESVTQNVSLPTGGANGVSVSWASSDAARISTTGTVTRTTDMNAMVILTATLTKNDARDTRTFTLTVVRPCTTSEMISKLKADPPSLSGCSAAGIRGADMPALVSAGATKEQLLAVWSADADTGFTPAQLKAAGVTVAEMKSHGLTIAQLRTGGIADYLVFNEACMPLSSKTCSQSDVSQECSTNHPTITLEKTTLTATDTAVVLEGVANGSLRWGLSGSTIRFDDGDSINDTQMLGSATGKLIRFEGITIISTLSIPLADVFSNPMVTVTNNILKNTTIQLCPGS